MKKWSLSDSFKSPIFWVGTAVWLWIILMLVVGITFARNPSHSVTLCYHISSAQWWAGTDLYGTREAMNYLPSFAIIFSLFHFLPAPAGDILWRFCSIALLSTGLWRLLKRVIGDDGASWFFLATILTLPLSAAAARNGQANTMLAALMLHAVVSLSTERWWQAAGLIMLAMVAKPIAIVLVLLAPVVYKPLRLPMAVSVVALVGFPFLFAKPDYVLSQYHGFLANLQACAVTPEHDYADIDGFLWPLHIQLSHAVSLGIRMSAGLLTLCLWWLGARRLREPLRALWLLTLAAGYLMIFNPMNETNSYVILAPVLAVWAAFFLHHSRHDGMGRTIVFMALTMGFLPDVFYPWVGSKFAHAYHPIMTILFLAMLSTWVLRGKAARPPDPWEIAGQSPVAS